MNIRFTPKARELYREMSLKTANWGNGSLDSRIINLMRWDGDGTITISTDFCFKSFFFSEEHENGARGMCGGIILHGVRGEFPPDFEANPDGKYCYSTHT